ncbi:hypothetical protein ACFQ3Z_00120 [Streptomyces nogalater]
MPGVDKDAIAVHLGKPRPLAKSSIALRNGAIFEQKVKADGGAELLRLLRDVLGLPLHEAAHTDLAAVGSQDASLPVRHAYTRTAVLEAARSPPHAYTAGPPHPAAHGRRPSRLPGTRRGRLPGRRCLPHHRDQVLRRPRRPRRPGEGGRHRHPGRRLRPRTA